MGISELISKLFPPDEVKATCKAIEDFLQRDFGFLGICLEQVRNEALAFAKETGKTVHTVKVDGIKPDHLALILIFNVLTRNLECGWNHIYRGVLSMTGTEMLKLWHITEKEMIKRGYQTQEQYAVDTEGLMKSIASMG
jgi:hypothetical protein